MSRGAKIAISLAIGVGALWVFGMLAYMGAFRDPTVSRVVRVEVDDICVVPIGTGAEPACIPNKDPDGRPVDVEAGDCVLVLYGEGISLRGGTDCPTSA